MNENGYVSCLLANIAARAHRTSDEHALRFLDETTDRPLTYGELWRSACAIADIVEQESAAGDRIGLVFPMGRMFIAAFLGCLLSRRIAVPLNEPRGSKVRRVLNICSDAAIELLLADTDDGPLLASTLNTSGGAQLKWIFLSDQDLAGSSVNVRRGAQASGLAFLQYTSGSTASPKGVMVSHENIDANIALKSSCLRLSDQTRILSWLPHHHDGGLIWGLLLPLTLGCEASLMSPRTFALRPMEWLAQASRQRATMLAAPNFAFEWCVTRFDRDALIGCDLSSVEIALNAADMIQAQTIERFIERFQDCGFRRSAMRPTYGLAEGTLFVCSGPGLYRSIDMVALRTDGNARNPIADGAGRVLAASGVPNGATEVAIVDSESHSRLGSDLIGEIWIRGPCVAAGYWGNEKFTRELFQQELTGENDPSWFRTGDVGFLCSQTAGLFVCGRTKNVVVFNGRKEFTEDIELTVLSSDPSLAGVACAALQVFDGSNEQLLVLLEDLTGAIRQRSAEIESSIRRAVSQEHGLRVDACIIVSRGSFKRTTSGKIQREAMKQAFQDGTIGSSDTTSISHVPGDAG